MKTFRDSSGTDWTVFEVRRNVDASGGDWSYLPSGFSDGWLCFESATAKKRLIRFPERWREYNEADLDKLLRQAQPAPRASFSLRVDDLGDRPPTGQSRPD